MPNASQKGHPRAHKGKKLAQLGDQERVDIPTLFREHSRPPFLHVCCFNFGISFAPFSPSFWSRRERPRGFPGCYDLNKCCNCLRPTVQQFCTQDPLQHCNLRCPPAQKHTGFRCAPPQVYISWVQMKSKGPTGGGSGRKGGMMEDEGDGARGWSNTLANGFVIVQ